MLDLISTKEFAKRIRIESLKMVHSADASHIGGSLSVADILATLYSGILNISPSNLANTDRDRLIYSKGHCCSALYATLALKGFFPLELLESFGKDGSTLTTHISHHVPGIEFSTGSLGHGLPVACGLALAAKRLSKVYKSFSILSDGELDEGSNWEAILFAGHHKLNNLIVTIDANSIQSLGTVSEVLDLEPLRAKFESFKWKVNEIDGHDLCQLSQAYSSARNEETKPTVIIARTIKGKGVDFMENRLLWHYRSPNRELLATAISQIEKEI